MRRSLRLASFLFLAGCTIVRSPQHAPSPGSGVEDRGPRATLERLDRHLRARGYAPAGPAVRNPNMPPGGMIAYALDVAAGQCFATFALTHPGTDLNLVVLDPQGTTVAYDVRPDPHPAAEFCAPRSGRYIIRLQMALGSGEYYFAAYQGPSGITPEFAAFFGAEDDVAESASIDSLTAKRLESLDEKLGKQGFVRTGEAQGVQLRQGQDRVFPLRLDGGACYVFASFAGPGILDTDVAIVDGGGTELAKDVGNDADGMVRYCPTANDSVLLRTRAHRGDGPIFVAGYAQSGRAVAGPIIPTKSVAGAGLEESFRLLDADLRARGYRSFGEPQRGRLEEGEGREFGVRLEGEKCYAILAVGDGTVRDLDLILLDGSGKQLDRDIEADPRPIVRVCPTQSGQFTMQVRAYSGGGQFVYAAYQWPRGTRGPFGLSGLLYVRLAEVTSLLGVEKYEPDPGFTPEKGTLARQGQSKTHEVELKAGACYAIAAVGGEGVADLDLRLSMGGREIVRDTTRNAFPAVRHCPQTTGRMTLTIEAAQGQGDYFFQVFERTGK